MAESLAHRAAEAVRNIALVGHAHSGKTTLTETLLALAGSIREPGSVENGNTVSDFTDQEKRAGHSLEVSVCHLEHDGARINLLDTPGYPDFVGKTLAVLPAVETVAMVVNAQHGIEFVTEQLMAAAADRKLCRLIVVNRIDESLADTEQVLAQIRSTFGRECLPLNLPARGGEMVADCFFEPAEADPDFSSVETAHTEITDQHTSHDEDNLTMSRRSIPEPMHALALTLSQRGQEKKLSDGLHKLATEDPSLVIEHDPQTNETIIKGMGELHLRLALDRLRDEFGLDVETHAPKVPYRETVTRSAEGHCRHKKQTGGAGQFGEVFLRVQPLERGTGFEFVNETVGGSIPGQFIPAVEKGVRQALEQGAVTGNPMQDIRVVVYDGKHHPVDSKEIAFVTAGKKAFLDAVSKASPIVLEPIARIQITLPNRFVGDISGHLAGIRGRIGANEATADGKSRITAQVPVAELEDFQATLKSLTGGEGVFTLQLDHYDPAPAQVQRTLSEAFRPAPETS
jgi:small GTP-binding protein